MSIKFDQSRSKLRIETLVSGENKEEECPTFGQLCLFFFRIDFNIVVFQGNRAETHYALHISICEA